MSKTEEEIAAVTEGYKKAEAERVVRRGERKKATDELKALPALILESPKSVEVQRAERDKRVQDRLAATAKAAEEEAAKKAAEEAAKETPAAP